MSRKVSSGAAAMPHPVGNVHDIFFKSMMADPELADQLLREYLPRGIAARLRPGPPELVSGSFVDEGQREHHTDLLLRSHLTYGRELWIYMLIDHKSSARRLARLQLLRYVARIHQRWEPTLGKDEDLPVVVPMIVHHGPRRWPFSTQLKELHGDVPEELLAYVSLRHELVDLAAIEDAALRGSVRLRTHLRLMKHITRRDLGKHLVSILADALTLARMDWVRLLTYIDRAAPRIAQTELKPALEQVAPNKVDEIMGSFTQEAFDKGRVEGHAQWLIQLLERRFAPVPDDVRARIRAADEATLQRWFDRAIEAKSLKTVFG